MFNDTHTHIYTEEFNADRQAVILRARQAGAKHLLLPNIGESSIEPMLQLCREFPGFCHPMIGLHPTELPDNPTPLLNHMENLLNAPEHPYIAIGEVGIDLYWDKSRREDQIAVLQRQAEWAIRFNLPLIIHSRSAHRDIINTLLPLRNELKSGGIFHCFSGTTEEATELLAYFPRFALGIGGVVTFKKSGLCQTLSDTVPLNRIVLETDAPYLAPTPHRGQRNEPSYIPIIIEKLAHIYATTPEEVANTTTSTVHSIFKYL